MIRLSFLYLLAGAKLLLSCGPAKKLNTHSPANQEVFFKASGTEPFWGIDLSDEHIRFSLVRNGTEKFEFRTPEAIRAADANVRLYQTSGQKKLLLVKILQKVCLNEMSGQEFPYEVTINFTEGDNPPASGLKGCGQYVTDYRLHDIWVLEKLNGRAVNPADFAKELPRLEIKAAENTFSGYTGCNAIRGTLFYEKDVLRFRQAAVTLRACPGGNAEKTFLDALSSTTRYSIANNRLTLFSSDKELLILKKTD